MTRTSAGTVSGTMSRFFLAVCVVSCGCGAGGGGFSAEERDVSGNYALRYDDRVRMTLDVGGVVREVAHSGTTGVVDFGTINGQPTTLDLGAFCAKPEVRCPSEAFWAKVAVTQPDLQANRQALQRLVVVNDTQHTLDAGVAAESLTGLVDHAQQDRFLLGLGAQGGSTSNCAAIAVSLAGGRFSRVGEREETTLEPRTSTGQVCSLDAGVPDGGMDAGASDGGRPCSLVPVKRLVVPPRAGVAGIEEGKVFVGWAGGCAFGPVLAGATLALETSFTGTRTGPYSPPPFTPSPLLVPDGGLDAGP